MMVNPKTNSRFMKTNVASLGHRTTSTILDLDIFPEHFQKKYDGEL